MNVAGKGIGQMCLRIVVVVMGVTQLPVAANALKMAMAKPLKTAMSISHLPLWTMMSSTPTTSLSEQNAPITPLPAQHYAHNHYIYYKPYGANNQPQIRRT